MLPMVTIRVDPEHQAQDTASGIERAVRVQEAEMESPRNDQVELKPGEAPQSAVDLETRAADCKVCKVPEVLPCRGPIRPLIRIGIFLTTLGLVWCGSLNSSWLSHVRRDELREVRPDDQTRADAIEAVVERIIKVESNGDPNAKNKRSSATGLGQFLNETWLDLIRTHRPDLAKGRSADETLELRRDPNVARELTVRFTEQNAGMLKKRGLPVTPGTLYLAHFAGGAGAVAILSALEDADAASVMASADASGRTKREKIIKANPFLERFTVADLKSWAHRKMRVPL
jgi:hypothetical protein